MVHQSPYGWNPIGRVEGDDRSRLESAELSGAALLLLLDK